jgi:hypothetical protein
MRVSEFDVWKKYSIFCAISEKIHEKNCQGHMSPLKEGTWTNETGKEQLLTLRSASPKKTDIL